MVLLKYMYVVYLSQIGEFESFNLSIQFDKIRWVFAKPDNKHSIAC